MNLKLPKAHAAAAAVMVLTLTSLAVAGAWSQTPMPDPLDDRSVRRLDKMEKVVRELRSIVFQGRDSGKPVVVQDAETPEQMQTLSNRLADLEQSLTRINGQNENLTYELDNSKKALTAAQDENRALADRLAALDKRVAEVEARGAAAPIEAPVAETAPPKGDPNTDFAKARQFMLDGDYDGAEAAFGRFIKQYGDNAKTPEARYWLGKTLSARGAQADAAGAYIGAIRGWPKTPWAPDAVVELSRSLIALKKPADACQTLEELARRYPKAPASVMGRATAARTQAKCAAA